jgi:preprotein translocase subunit Sec63
MISDPYEVLRLARDADSDAIRRRYLELVRQFPPERSPAEFGKIREAYDRLRDPVVSLENRLFSVTASETFDGLLARLRPDVRRKRLSAEALLSLARP